MNAIQRQRVCSWGWEGSGTNACPGFPAVPHRTLLRGVDAGREPRGGGAGRRPRAHLSVHLDGLRLQRGAPSPAQRLPARPRPQLPRVGPHHEEAAVLGPGRAAGQRLCPRRARSRWRQQREQGQRGEQGAEEARLPAARGRHVRAAQGAPPPGENAQRERERGRPGSSPALPAPRAAPARSRRRRHVRSRSRVPRAPSRQRPPGACPARRRGESGREGRGGRGLEARGCALPTAHTWPASPLPSQLHLGADLPARGRGQAALSPSPFRRHSPARPRLPPRPGESLGQRK